MFLYTFVVACVSAIFLCMHLLIPSPRKELSTRNFYYFQRESTKDHVKMESIGRYRKVGGFRDWISIVFTRSAVRNKLPPDGKTMGLSGGKIVGLQAKGTICLHYVTCRSFKPLKPKALVFLTGKYQTCQTWLNLSQPFRIRKLSITQFLHLSIFLGRKACIHEMHVAGSGISK